MRSPSAPCLDPLPGWELTYNADGMATVHNADFMHDPLFQSAYQAGERTGHKFGADLHIEWRTHVACWAAYQAKQLTGDYVECGVNTGIYSTAVMRYIDFASMPDRRFYLLDTYRGIPVEQMSEQERELGMEAANSYYEECYERVRGHFACYPNAKVIRGMVPETLEQIDSDRICYVSIDMNCVKPEMAAGEYLWPRMVSGAIVVLDDYGWKTHIQQKHAWDAFADARGLKVLALPTGQGLLIKP